MGATHAICDLLTQPLMFFEPSKLDEIKALAETAALSASEGCW